MYWHRVSILLFILWWSGPALSQDLRVEANFEGMSSISRYEPLVLTFSRHPEPAEGRIGIFLGQTDLTALFTSAGLDYLYTPKLIPLSSGQQDLTVYLVGEDNQWQEIARFSVQVRLPGGFEQVDFGPNLSINNKGQVVEGQFPKPPEELPRRVYQDFTGQFNGQLNLQRPGWTTQAQFNVVGVTYQNEALRFGELQEEAPKVDLSRYLVQVENDQVSVHVGHVAHGRHKMLVNSFGSRGTMAEVNVGERFDFSLAAMNGSRVVGWSNPLGLNDPNHRIYSGTVGLEMLEGHPGGFRIEASYLSGSVLPFSGFNQGAVVDAEKSQGAGTRVLASSRNQRFRFEGGFAGSRFTNPKDPDLSNGADLIPVETTTRFAHYADVSIGVLQNVQVTPSFPFNLSLNLRRERVDPLYRTVAAFVRSDALQHSLDVQGSLGAVYAQFSHSRSEDNLDKIPSILKTKTNQNNVSVGVPLASFAGASAGKGVVLLPSLSYNFNRTHQFGADVPVGGGFNPSHIPDQFSTQHNVSADWTGNRWRLGYRYGHAFQDNRQEGREDADFLNVTNNLSVGLTPWRVLDLSVDLNFDMAESKADERIDRTRRLGFRVSLRPIQVLSFSGSISPTRTQDDGQLSLRTSNNINLEGSWTFGIGPGTDKIARGQLFVRYTRQANRNRDITFDFDSENRSWRVNTGVSLTLF